MKHRIAALAILTLALFTAGPACKSQKSDSTDLQGLTALLQSGSGQRDISEMAAVNGENDMGNPVPGRAPDHIPLWPPRGDFGFFAPEVVNSVDGSYNTTITSEVKNCPGGGTVTLGGTQTVQVQTSADSVTRTVAVSAGQRTIHFDHCALNPMTTVNSGDLTIAQQGTAQLTIVKDGTSGERHTVTGLTFTITGKVDVVNVRPSGPPPMQGGMSGPSNQVGASGPGQGGPQGGGMNGPPPMPPSGIIEFNITVNVERRILAWQGTASSLERPQLVERTGTVTGTVTTNGVVRDIQRTMQLSGS